MAVPRTPIGAQLNFGHKWAEGLVGWWPLNERSGNVAHDYSKFKAHGTYTFSVNMDRVERASGSGIQFIDAGTAEIAIPRGAGIDAIYTSQEFTIAVWYTLESTGIWRGLFGYTSLNWGNGFSLHASGNSGQGRGWIDVFTNFADHVTTGFGTAPIFSVLTYGGSNIRIYYNGVEESFTADAGGLGTDPAQPSAFIGHTQGGGPERHDGDIYEVRTWDRALSATEVLEMFHHPNEWLESESIIRFLSPPEEGGGPSLNVIESSVMRGVGRGIMRGTAV